MIDFDFSPEQRELARVARDAFAAGEDAFAKLGLEGADPVDLVLVLEEAGRAGIVPGIGDAGAAAAVLNGVSMRLLEMSVEHAKSREQFGRPIGAFQAVKHKLASMRTLLDSARPAAWYAAHARTPLSTSVAKVEACRAHEVVNREALQIHGGIGFTREHRLHVWLELGLSLTGAFGSAAEHRARIASSLFDEGSADA